MFLKKEKPEFEIRPLYSIREELELIKEFCWQPKLAAGKIYTEEEIDAVEQRLNYKLPQPLRELYLVLPPGGTPLERTVPAGGGHGKNPSGMWDLPKRPLCVGL